MPYRSRDAFIMLAVLIGGTGLAAADKASSPPTGAMHAKSQIKPGLWEFGDSAKVTGDTVFPDAVLDQVPAAQRSQHLAALRQMISQPSRKRECITQAVFEQRLFGIETGCQRALVSNAAGRLEVLTQCHGAAGGLTQSKTMPILATSATGVPTAFQAVSTRAGKAMTVDSVEHGQRVSANCGDVHAIQQS
jgi:hypothetical protein